MQFQNFIQSALEKGTALLGVQSTMAPMVPPGWMEHSLPYSKPKATVAPNLKPNSDAQTEYAFTAHVDKNRVQAIKRDDQEQAGRLSRRAPQAGEATKYAWDSNRGRAYDPETGMFDVMHNQWYNPDADLWDAERRTWYDPKFERWSPKAGRYLDFLDQELTEYDAQPPGPNSGFNTPQNSRPPSRGEMQSEPYVFDPVRGRPFNTIEARFDTSSGMWYLPGIDHFDSVRHVWYDPDFEAYDPLVHRYVQRDDWEKIAELYKDGYIGDTASDTSAQTADSIKAPPNSEASEDSADEGKASEDPATPADIADKGKGPENAATPGNTADKGKGPEIVNSASPEETGDQAQGSHTSEHSFHTCPEEGCDVDEALEKQYQKILEEAAANNISEEELQDFLNEMENTLHSALRDVQSQKKLTYDAAVKAAKVSPLDIDQNLISDPALERALWKPGPSGAADKLVRTRPDVMEIAKAEMAAKAVAARTMDESRRQVQTDAAIDIMNLAGDQSVFNSLEVFGSDIASNSKIPSYDHDQLEALTNMVETGMKKTDWYKDTGDTLEEAMSHARVAVIQGPVMYWETLNQPKIPQKVDLIQQAENLNQQREGWIETAGKNAKQLQDLGSQVVSRDIITKKTVSAAVGACVLAATIGGVLGGIFGHKKKRYNTNKQKLEDCHGQCKPVSHHQYPAKEVVHSFVQFGTKTKTKMQTTTRTAKASSATDKTKARQTPSSTVASTTPSHTKTPSSTHSESTKPASKSHESPTFGTRKSSTSGIHGLTQNSRASDTIKSQQHASTSTHKQMSAQSPKTSHTFSHHHSATSTEKHEPTHTPSTSRTTSHHHASSISTKKHESTQSPKASGSTTSHHHLAASVSTKTHMFAQSPKTSGTTTSHHHSTTSASIRKHKSAQSSKTSGTTTSYHHWTTSASAKKLTSTQSPTKVRTRPSKNPVPVLVPVHVGGHHHHKQNTTHVGTSKHGHKTNSASRLPRPTSHGRPANIPWVNGTLTTSKNETTANHPPVVVSSHNKTLTSSHGAAPHPTVLSTSNVPKWKAPGRHPALVAPFQNGTINSNTTASVVPTNGTIPTWQPPHRKPFVSQSNGTKVWNQTAIHPAVASSQNGTFNNSNAAASIVPTNGIIPAWQPPHREPIVPQDNTTLTRNWNGTAIQTASVTATISQWHASNRKPNFPQSNGTWIRNWNQTTIPTALVTTTISQWHTSNRPIVQQGNGTFGGTNSTTTVTALPLRTSAFVTGLLNIAVTGIPRQTMTPATSNNQGTNWNGSNWNATNWNNTTRVSATTSIVSLNTTGTSTTSSHLATFSVASFRTTIVTMTIRSTMVIPIPPSSMIETETKSTSASPTTMSISPSDIADSIYDSSDASASGYPIAWSQTETGAKPALRGKGRKARWDS